MEQGKLRLKLHFFIIFRKHRLQITKQLNKTFLNWLKASVFCTSYWVYRFLLESIVVKLITVSNRGVFSEKNPEDTLPRSSNASRKTCKMISFPTLPLLLKIWNFENFLMKKVKQPPPLSPSPLTPFQPLFLHKIHKLP